MGSRQGLRHRGLRILILSCSRNRAVLWLASARCDVRWVAAVFVGSGGTEERCSAISSCRSAARTSRNPPSVVARRGNYASAPSSSARRRAISRRSQLSGLVILNAWVYVSHSSRCSATGQASSSRLKPATTARAMIVFKLDVVDQVVVQDYRQVRADQVEFSWSMECS